MCQSNQNKVEGARKAFQAEGTTGAKVLQQKGAQDAREVEEKPVRQGVLMGLMWYETSWRLSWPVCGLEKNFQT